MNSLPALSFDVLKIDYASEADKIGSVIRSALKDPLRRQGIVLGLSGGIDSSTTAALAVHAIGKDRVFGLLMPEKDSGSETLRLSKSVAQHLKIRFAEENISAMLEAFGCYRRRDEAIRSVIPQFGPDWKSKIVLPSVTASDQFRLYSIVAQSPDGKVIQERLTSQAYLGIVAATNFKQRTRKTLEYYYADKLNYAVAGTPNRLEYDQGFFVKNGDGAADIKPIAHLYKTQVYEMARHLGLPDEICSRPPTTDTYSLPQSQEEFYFSLPYDKMDLCLWAKNHGYSPQETAPAMGLSAEQIRRVYDDIDQKRRSTRYLQVKHLLIEKVPEVE
jgi:NAD+ synthase